jgi:hypothetical protein
MTLATDSPWLHQFVLAGDIARSGQSAAFYRSFRAGGHRRLAEGVFLPRTVWDELTGDDRFRAQVHAVALAAQHTLVFSHFSAATLWRLPMTGAWPPKPEVVVDVGAVGATRQAFNARRYGIPTRLEEIDGLSVTPLVRTLVDVGRSSPLSISVAMMDRALSPFDASAAGPSAIRISKESLVRERGLVRSARGVRRCESAIELADGASGSAGESLSRVGMHLLGLPAPVLQQEFRDSRGLIGFADFWWPELGLVGEFDGLGKYIKREFTKGRTAADIVLAEKAREDRLRALGLRVTRWGWETARSLPMLRAHLAGAGLR